MCDDEIHVGRIEDPRPSRRAFGMMAAAAAGLGGTAYAAGVSEKDVEVKTPDGTADAVLMHPEGQGKWPAVLIWTDIAGLRPVFREMGGRLAAQGYTVLVPNPFYRSAKAPVVGPDFDFNRPEDRARLFAMRGAMSDAGIDKDATAYLAFLDAQPQTDTARKAGVQGYCMGGPLAFRTAAAVPGRIGAVGSFHGAGLVTKEPSSPHLLIPKTLAAYAVCIARNDDERQPEAKDVLKAAFAEAHRPATVKVYPANHGWCVRGSPVYDEAQAERAWKVLSDLYKQYLT
jgi:carboxymethylenebutenolidase